MAIAPGYAPTFVSPVECVARTFIDKLNATGATKADWDNFRPFLAYSENNRAKTERGSCFSAGLFSLHSTPPLSLL